MADAIAEGEQLAREQWLYCADRIDERLGFTGPPRAAAFHPAPCGESHMHVAWSRIDAGNMRALDPGLYKNKLKEICRELEQELRLTPVRNEPLPGYKTRCAAWDEFDGSAPPGNRSQRNPRDYPRMLGSLQ